jgi:hypothetical protein
VKKFVKKNVKKVFQKWVQKSIKNGGQKSIKNGGQKSMSKIENWQFMVGNEKKVRFMTGNE